MNTQSPVVLLMTGTINPFDCPDAKFSVEERLEQYKKAFRFYVDRLDVGEKCRGYTHLVFAENSGWDLAELGALVPEGKKARVELLALPKDRFNPSLGKSYNEELIIDLACDRSRFLQEGDSFFMKVTGRYSIRNIDAFIRECRRKLPELDFYCDCKDHRLFSTLGLRWCEQWCDTRRIGFRVSFYRKHIYGRSPEFANGRYFTLENQMFDLSRQVRQDPRTIHRARRELRIDGLDGHRVHFCNIDIPRRWQGVYYWCRSVPRNFIRMVFPFLWI